MIDFLEKIIILSEMINVYKDEQTLTEMETGMRDKNQRDSASIAIDGDNLFINFYSTFNFDVRYNKVTNIITISDFGELYSTKESTKILLEKIFLSLRRHIKENFEKNIKIIEDMML